MIESIMSFLTWKKNSKIGTRNKDIPLDTVEKRYEYIKHIFKGKKVSTREYLFMILMDNHDNHVKTVLLNSMKGNFVSVDLREIIEPLAKYKPAKIMFTHNHPNGDVRPSIQDYAFTNDMHDICDGNNISVIDHIIIGDGYFSLAEDDSLH